MANPGRKGRRVDRSILVELFWQFIHFKRNEQDLLSVCELAAAGAEAWFFDLNCV